MIIRTYLRVTFLKLLTIGKVSSNRCWYSMNVGMGGMKIPMNDK